ncbi:MAG: IS30 family transposase [Pseudomonadales bacterium]|nr:IS30 family transposase [Pseudomonadales bacterium]
MKRQYQQLTYELRCQISALKKSGLSQRQMANVLEVSQPTISRELSRNSGKKGYHHKQAQNKATSRRKESHKPTKMTPTMIRLIEFKLSMEWSPEQISGWLLESRDEFLSHEAIYLHIWADKKSGGCLYKKLRRQGKKYDKRRNGKSTRGHIKNRVSIDERPKIVDAKKRIGDWEIDTVIGKDHKGALVTIVERVTKFTVSRRVNRKTAANVAKATIELLKPYKALVHTITADNGKEFADHEKISKALCTEFYFAHPYSSWERGLNENTNGLLRQYFPKGTDFRKVSQAAVQRAVRRLNSRPRKDLSYQTPNQLMIYSRNTRALLNPDALRS